MHREDAMEENARAHLVVSGRVQGVFFRAETQKAAMVFGVSGWVRNRRNGTVEAVVEGARKDVLSLINWCNTGPPLSKVDRVEVTWRTFNGEFSEFGIRY
jgi:acylphosphatase